MSDSEMMSIRPSVQVCVFYHYSGYKCFQYYYQDMVQRTLKSYFPRQVSYERFVLSLLRILPGLYVFLKYCTLQSRLTGLYFIDSKQLPVCDNRRTCAPRRIHSHRVFEPIATSGISSTGWFFGLKLHLVINNLGQVVNFLLTPANVADNNHALLHSLLDGLKGECYGDKGYMTGLFEHFYTQGLQIITKLKASMANQLMPVSHKIRLKKRAVIESVNHILTSVFDLEHTRHRNPFNALAHIFSGLIAYCFYDTQPAVFAPNNQQLMIA